MKNYIKVKLYLKHKLKAFTLILQNDAMLQQMIDNITSNDTIKIGDLVFNHNEFKYLIIKR